MTAERRQFRPIGYAGAVSRSNTSHISVAPLAWHSSTASKSGHVCLLLPVDVETSENAFPSCDPTASRPVLARINNPKGNPARRSSQHPSFSQRSQSFLLSIHQTFQAPAFCTPTKFKMSVPKVYEECKKAGMIALILMDHDDTTSKKDATPPWKVIPADGYLEAVEGLLRNGDLVIPLSARGLVGLLEAYKSLDRFNLTIGYNDGQGFYQSGPGVAPRQRDIKVGEEPDWTATMERLSTTLTVPEGALVAQGYSFFYYVKKVDDQDKKGEAASLDEVEKLNDKKDDPYQKGETAFLDEVKMLNDAAGVEKFRYGAYPNGHIIELAEKVGKAQGIKNYLTFLCDNKFNCNLEQLFKEFIGCVMFADDSTTPTVKQALKDVMNLKTQDGKCIGHSIQVSRDGIVPATPPDYVNEVLRNPTEMVAMLQAMADYVPVN
ncbi:hypothetical protein ACCS93_33325 [Rhizobium ruizarguesonis]